MPLVLYDVEIPKQTHRDNPLEYDIDVILPVIDYCRIRFQAGPRGSVGIRLTDRGKTFAPGPPHYGWIIDDENIVEWKEGRELDGPPYKVRIIAYNMARDHPHTIQVRLDVVEFTLEMLIDDLRKSIRELNQTLKGRRL